MHTEKLLQITQGSSELLYAGEDTVVERLGRVLASLDEASAIDPVLKPVTEDLRTALYQMEEAGRTLGDYASRVEFDPARLAEIERLAELSTLKRKYGATVDDILRIARASPKNWQRCSTRPTTSMHCIPKSARRNARYVSRRST